MAIAALVASNYWFLGAMLVQSQSTESDRLLAFLKEEVRVDIRVENSTFILRRCSTKHFVNENNSTLYLEMQPGILGLRPEGSISSLINACAFDNLGTPIAPVLDESMLLTPLYRVTIPPFSNYDLSLAYETPEALHNHGLLLYYGFGLSPAEGRQDVLDVRFRFPENWTILEYSAGGFVNETSAFPEICWNTKLVAPTDFDAKFLAFQTNVTNTKMWEESEIIRDHEITVAISSVSISKGEAELSISYLFEVSPVMVEQWSPYAPYAFIEVQPMNLSDLEIFDVRDQHGPLSEDPTLPAPTYSFLPTMPVTWKNQNSGYYRLDLENNGIVIYPRYHLKKENYFFGVAYKLRFSMNFIEIFPTPYRRGFVFRTGLPRSEVMASNISSTLMTKFIFPEVFEPLTTSEPHGAKLGKENDNPTLSWIESYNDFSAREYTIFFDITPLRRAFTGGLLLTAVEAIIAIFCTLALYLGKIDNRIAIVLIGMMATIFVAYVGFINTLGYDLFLSFIGLFFIVQLVCLSVTLFCVVTGWRSKNDKSSQSARHSARTKKL